MLTDTIFLTNLFNRKRKTENYEIMVASIMLVSATTSLFLKGEFATVLQVIFSIIIVLFFTLDLKAVMCFNFSFTLMCFVEVFIISTLRLPYISIGILGIIIKLFFILTVFKEVEKVDLNFKTITVKVLNILFSFICLCMSIYINLNRR